MYHTLCILIEYAVPICKLFHDYVAKFNKSTKNNINKYFGIKEDSTDLNKYYQVKSNQM